MGIVGTSKFVFGHILHLQGRMNIPVLMHFLKVQPSYKAEAKDTQKSNKGFYPMLQLYCVFLCNQFLLNELIFEIISTNFKQYFIAKKNLR